MNDFALKTIYSEANRCSKPAALQQLLFISNRTPSSKKANGEGAFLSSHCTSFLPELRSKGLKGVWASGSHPKTVLAATLPARDRKPSSLSFLPSCCSSSRQAEMAEIPLHSCSGLLGLRFSHALLAFWCTFVGSGSAVTVTQTPSFVNGSTGTEISFRCSVDEAGYRLFWYQQLPGKTELKVLGNFYSGDRDLQEKHKDWQNRLKAKWEDSNSRKMHLDLLRLQANDTGFYLCAAVYTVNEVGIEAGTKLSIRISFPTFS
ncbi:hypothetical protein E2320_020742 [Naja naja]|nr:hypothetical protein E2320_020742 [Naja naja]